MKTAILIDSDNTNPHSLRSMWDGLSQLGHIVCARAYGDWHSSALKFMQEVCEALGIQLVQQTVYVTGKNATDMAMTIDAVDLYHQHEIEQVVLVTSDSDFTPLATWLCHRQVAVVGVLGEESSWAFRRACTRTFEYQQVCELAKACTPKTSEKVRLLMDTLFVHLCVFAAHKTSFTQTELVAYLNDIEPDFSCMRYGHESVKNLLLSSERWEEDPKVLEGFRPISAPVVAVDVFEEDVELTKAFSQLHQQNMQCPLYSGYLTYSDVEQQLSKSHPHWAGHTLKSLLASAAHPQRVFYIPHQESVIWVNMKTCCQATFRAKELLLRVIDKQLRLHGQTMLIYPGHLRKAMKELDPNFTWAKYGASSFSDLMAKHSDLLLPVKTSVGDDCWSVSAGHGVSQYQQIQVILSCIRGTLSHNKQIDGWMDEHSWEAAIHASCKTFTLRRAGLSRVHCIWWVFSDQIEVRLRPKSSRVARFKQGAIKEKAA